MVTTLLAGILCIGILYCGIQAVRAPQLLTTALWLAGVSALVAVALYMLGAPQVAVIELSVGAGLVTILFVFALSIAGEVTLDLPSLIPKPLAWILMSLALVGLGWMGWPQVAPAPAVTEPDFTTVLWEQRTLDVWIQISLIFSGVLGVLGLLTEEKAAEQEVAEHASVVKQKPDNPDSRAYNQPSIEFLTEQKRQGKPEEISS